MNTQTLYENAEMAWAAYAIKDEKIENRLKSLKEEDFSNTQANAFMARYPKVLKVADEEKTGFQAAVFQDLKGQLTLAIRGTEKSDWKDLVADGQIVMNGMAYDQILSMYNWWQRVSHAQGTSVLQYRLKNNALVSSKISATGELAAALAQDPDRKIDVTGHSLGGHLAMAFGALFAKSTGQVTAFNAPGFKSTSQSAGISNVAFFKTLGGAMPTGVNTVNVIADEASIGKAPWSAIAGLHNRPGEWVNLSIEDQSNEPLISSLTTTLITKNHSQMVLVDALAVYKMLGQLDPQWPKGNTNAFKSLLHIASNESYRSLECLTDAMETFMGVNTQNLPVGHKQREALYQALESLQNHAVFKSLVGKLTISANMVTPAGAKSDFAQFLSLYDLLPMCVQLADPSAKSALLNARAEVADQWQRHSVYASEHWLQDRSVMQSWLIKMNSEDMKDKVTHQPAAMNAYYEDVITGKRVTVGDTSVAQIRQFKFGDNQNNALIGGSLNDRLYGGLGEDTLEGLAGRDWLEGGVGLDTYKAGDGDVICDTDGKGVLVLGGKSLSGPIQSISENQWKGAAGETYIHFGNDIVIQLGSDQVTLKNSYQQACNGGYLGFTLSGEGQVPEKTVTTYTGSNLRDVWEWRRLSGFGFLETAGTESFKMGEGDDQVASVAGGDLFFGEAGNDVFIATEGNNHAEGGPGDDVLADGLLLNYVLKNVYVPGTSTYNPYLGYIVTPGTWVSKWMVPTVTRGVVKLDADGVVMHVMNGTLFRPIDSDDTLIGGDGADWLIGSGGQDVLEGGDGQDVGYGGSGFDALMGGEGDDTLSGDDCSLNLNASYHGNDYIDAGAGNDCVFGNGGDDVLIAGDGNDAVWGDDDFMVLSFQGDDNIDAGAGNDTVYGGGGNDFITGGDGQDILIGSEGDDELWGQAGDDWLKGDMPEESERFKGEHVFGTTTDLNVDVLKQNLANGTVERYTADPTYPGGSDSLMGGDGHDTLMGGRGDDTLDGGQGSDTFVFNKGDGIDMIRDDAFDAVSVDTLQLGEGLLASETVLIKDEQNLYVGWNDGDMVVVWDQFKPASQTMIERMVFADGTVWDREWLFAKSLGAKMGSNAADTLLGGATDDVLMGAGGNDDIVGGKGNDTLLGGDGNDKLDDDGYAVKQGYGDDLLDGGRGDDTLFGGDGFDTLKGDSGQDVLQGESSDDELRGGEGDDTLYGGTGADRFVFDGLSSTGRGDVIVDFKSSEGDKLVFDHGFFKALEGMTTLSDHVRSYTASSVGGDDYIVYDNTTGNLYYDPTGLNNASAVLIANLQNKPLTMAANAFAVI